MADDLDPASATGPIPVLYGAPASLYTAKARAFFRAHRIPFLERFPSHPRYRQVIRPAVETHRIPVVEFPDGEIVQDSSAILDALERRHPQHASAGLGPKQRVATRLLELVGDRGLAKPAMHYRWSYPAENEAFILGEFGRSLRFPAPPEEVGRLGRRVADKMGSYLPMLGITPRSIPTIEAAYAETLHRLDTHFGDHPFVLGGAPTRGDFALMGPLYGHLGRDPYPLRLMQQHAPLTFRWTERINMGDRGAPEFPEASDAPWPGDEVPETLVAVIRHLMEGFADELVQSAEALNASLAGRDLGPGAWISPEGADQPILGPIAPLYHGVAVEQMAQAHPLWLLQRAQDELAALSGAARREAEGLVLAAGAAPAMAVRLSRRLTRVRNRLAVE